MNSKKISIPKVIGHRGACGYAPENTLAAMHKAFELGVEWVEFDVMLTADGTAIIMHDYKLDRTTSGRGKVANAKYTDIAKLDAGSWFATEFAAEKIPTFIELLKYLAKLNLKMNIEIKPTPGSEIKTAQQTIKILFDHWQGPTPLISSAAIQSLKTVREIDSQIPLGFISDKWPKNWQEILDSLNCISLHINYRKLNSERIAAVKQIGKHVLAYTVNTPTLAKKLFAMGVDGVFSDFPDKILKM